MPKIQHEIPLNKNMLLVFGNRTFAFFALCNKKLKVIYEEAKHDQFFHSSFSFRLGM